MEAKAVFEFGSGVSTRVLLDALQRTGGSLISCSTEGRSQVCGGLLFENPRWLHMPVTSDVALRRLRGEDPGVTRVSFEPFDLVLHDGSHAANTVSQDLAMIAPLVKQYGLILIHDTQHSYVGPQVREGLLTGLRGVEYSLTTLPYGFGLTIVRIEGNAENGQVQITRGKVGSPHRTELTPVGLSQSRSQVDIPAWKVLGTK